MRSFGCNSFPCIELECAFFQFFERTLGTLFARFGTLLSAEIMSATLHSLGGAGMKEAEKEKRRERKIQAAMDGLIDYEFMKVELKPPKPVRGKDTLKETGLLLRDLNRLLKFRGSGARKQTPSARFFGNTNGQRCMVKMRYGTEEKIHKEFLRRYMPQKEKVSVEDKPTLFGAKSDGLTEEEVLEYEKKMSPLHFRFIVSPESQKVPLKALVRSFVRRLEMEIGHSFTWVAVEHYDTSQQHAHILINGTDAKTGEEIRFKRKVVTMNSRIIAEAVCTQLVGPPSQEESERRKEALPLAQWFTRLDADIEAFATTFAEPKDIDGTVYESKVIARNDEQARRLKKLVEMGFAKKFGGNEPPMFYLEKDWAEKLRTVGRYNTFLTARASLTYTSACNLEQYTPEAGTVEGVVTHTFVTNDDDVWTNGIVIENKASGNSFFLPLYKRPMEGIKGKMVRITSAKNQKGLLSPKIILLESGRTQSI